MNASQIFQDIDTGALTEVAAAACSYYDEARGLTARQQFFIYPNDTIVSLTYIDGGYSAVALCGDDAAIFQHRHPAYFQ